MEGAAPQKSRRTTGTGPASALTLCLLACLGAPGANAQVADPEAALSSERDALIRKIARGDDPQASLRAFLRLAARREQLLTAAKEAADRAQKAEEAVRQREAAEQQRAQDEQRRQQEREALAAEAAKRLAAERADYLNSIDHSASKYCHLSADPQKRHVSGGISSDWGRVVRKQIVRLPAANALADERVFTMYEIAGVRDRHLVRNEKLFAEVGDLIFLCGGPGNPDRELPPPWDGRLTTGYMARLRRPPLLADADKARHDPIHITLNNLFWAIRDVKWRFPTERSFLASVMVAQDLGEGRYEIPAGDREVSFVLEVPKTLPRRELLKPEEWVWVIMNNPRFDRNQKKLVLTAVDIERRYLIEK